jgi:hypothetical protein
MGCRQCLPLSVVQLKGKHCRKPHCRNGVVDTFRHRQSIKGPQTSVSSTYIPGKYERQFILKKKPQV